VRDCLLRGAMGITEEHGRMVVTLVNMATDLVGRGVDCDRRFVVRGKNRQSEGICN
jgi:hypothetical protein